MSASLDVTITSSRWSPRKHWHAIVSRAVNACAREAGAAWPDREISVLLCDDARIRLLNHEWRGFDKATNVLSFPTPATRPDAPLGDIAIAFETAQAEARAEDKTLDDHVTHLAIHGVLHLLGRDHETSAEAEAMEAAERRILATLGIADPYAASEPALAEGAS